MITWDKNNKSTKITLSNNNLTASRGECCIVKATEGKLKGKWYWEVYINQINALSKNYSALLLGESVPVETTPWKEENAIGYIDNGSTFTNDNILKNNLEQYIINDTIGIAIDLDSDKKTIRFYKNGKFITEEEINITDNLLYPACASGASSGAITTANFGNSKFNMANLNRKEWSDLIKKGYKPYDIENAKWNWLSYKFLLKSNNEYYTVKQNKIVKLENYINTKEFYMNNGFYDINLEGIKSFFDDINNVKVLVYSEENNIDINTKCELIKPFKPIDKLKKIGDSNFDILIKSV